MRIVVGVGMIESFFNCVLVEGNWCDVVLLVMSMIKLGVGLMINVVRNITMLNNWLSMERNRTNNRIIMANDWLSKVGHQVLRFVMELFMGLTSVLD